MTKKECKYKEEHIDEDECIDYNHKEKGGNWRKIICWILGHDWYYVYSWIGYCNRCLRRDEKRKKI